MSDFAKQPCPKCGEILSITITCDHEKMVADLRAKLDLLENALTGIASHRNWRSISYEDGVAMSLDVEKYGLYPWLGFQDVLIEAGLAKREGKSKW